MPEGRILIVEDDVELAERLRDFFEARGYEVKTAALGQEAITLCRRWIPDIVIQDIRLPDMDGFEVARNLAQSPRTKSAGIFFLTQLDNRESKLQGLSLGAIDYVAKPFDLEELELKVRNAVKALRRPRPQNPITGLLNRETLALEMAPMLRKGSWTAFRISLEGIEEFRDVYGFLAADDLLRAVALVLKNLLAQIGGEGILGHLRENEFLLLSQAEKVEEVENKLREAVIRTIEAFYPAQEISGKHTELLSVKFGKASIEGREGLSIEDLEKATEPLVSLGPA